MRRRIASVDRAEASRAITSHIEEILPPEGLILAFEPLPDEPDIGSIIEPLRAQNRLVLVEGEHAAPTLSSHDIVLALVPGRAFGRDGHRIGRGGGTFDRILAKLDCEKIGVAFECQIVDHVPREGHDVPMDRLVTERGLFNPL